MLWRRGWALRLLFLLLCYCCCCYGVYECINDGWLQPLTPPIPSPRTTRPPSPLSIPIPRPRSPSLIDHSTPPSAPPPLSASPRLQVAIQTAGEDDGVHVVNEGRTFAGGHDELMEMYEARHRNWHRRGTVGGSSRRDPVDGWVR